MRRPSALLTLAQGALTIVVLAAGLYTLVFAMSAGAIALGAAQ